MADCSSLPLFKKFSSFIHPVLKSRPAPKRYFFEADSSEGKQVFLVTLTASKEDGPVWKAAQELLEFGLKAASAQMRGAFGYDLVSADISGGMKTFIPANFSALLANHGKAMAPGEKRLIQYGPFWGVLSKRIPLDWGKIEFRSPVEIVPKETEKLDLYLKGIVNEGKTLCAEAATLHIVIQVVGGVPLLHPDHPAQKERLENYFGKEKGEGVKVYFFHKEALGPGVPEALPGVPG
jgi:hypothetical protein